MNNPLAPYNYVPTTVNGNQFVAYKQHAGYMTDYRPSSDTYGYLIREASDKGILTGHQLRQYMQDHSLDLGNRFFQTAMTNFNTMQLQGAPNTCSGYEGGVVYSGGKALINDKGEAQVLKNSYDTTGKRCMMLWDNTPLAQQGPHYQSLPPDGTYNKFSLLD